MNTVLKIRCPEADTKCPPGCNSKGTYNGIPPVTPESIEQREHIQEMLASTSRTLLNPNLNQIRNGTGNSSEFSTVYVIFLVVKIFEFFSIYVDYLPKWVTYLQLLCGHISLKLS